MMSVDEHTETSTHGSITCIDTMITGGCRPEAGILMEDILESDSGLFSKDQTLAAFRHARNRQYLCVYS